MNLLTHQGIGLAKSAAARWIRRSLYLAAGVAIVVLSFFFIAIALIAGLVLALAIGARIWWITRALRARQRSRIPLEGEYVSVCDEPAAASIIDGRQSGSDRPL